MGTLHFMSRFIYENKVGGWEVENANGLCIQQQQVDVPLNITNWCFNPCIHTRVVHGKKVEGCTNFLKGCCQTFLRCLNLRVKDQIVHGQKTQGLDPVFCYWSRHPSWNWCFKPVVKTLVCMAKKNQGFDPLFCYWGRCPS